MLQRDLHGFVIILLLLLSMQSHAGTSRLEIVAWVENAVLVGPAVKLKAKLDTGAETSSISRSRTVRV